MSLDYDLSPLARRHVREIHDHIAKDNANAAESWVEDILQTCQFLADHPRAGRDRCDLLPELRGFPVGNYIVFYFVLEGRPKILSVYDGRRDLPRLFTAPTSQG